MCQAQSNKEKIVSNSKVHLKILYWRVEAASIANVCFPQNFVV